jgi:hypothetical protein
VAFFGPERLKNKLAFLPANGSLPPLFHLFYADSSWHPYARHFMMKWKNVNP